MIRRVGSHFVLETEQFFDRTPIELFSFFSDAQNLSRITPSWLDFRILTPQPIAMREGALIDYRLKLYGVPMRWRTEITAWEPPHRFIDSQVKGPYRFWVHEHVLTPHDGGTLMRDIVTFQSRGPDLFVPMIHRMFVNRNVQRIFTFRRSTLRNKFPVNNDESSATKHKAEA